MNNNQNNNTLPPQPPMAGTPYQMPPKKKMSKGVFWGIIGGVVAIIAIVGIVLAFVFLGGSGDKKGGAQVSKEDYKDFYSQINKLDISRDVERSKYASLSYRGIERTLGEIDEEYKELGSHKALADEDLKEAYDEALKDWNDSIKPAIYAAYKVSTDEDVSFCELNTYASYMKPDREAIDAALASREERCMKAVERFEKSDDKIVSQYGKALRKYWSEDIKNFLLESYKYYSELKNNPNAKLRKPKEPKNPEVQGEKSRSDHLEDYAYLKKLAKKKSNEK